MFYRERNDGGLSAAVECPEGLVEDVRELFWIALANKVSWAV